MQRDLTLNLIYKLLDKDIVSIHIHYQPNMSNGKGLPWIEKYRPSHIDDITLNANLSDKLKKMDLCNNMPNMILLGPPGVGKTTSIVCIAKSILGIHCSDAMLTLNASDDRGINAVDIIETFCKKSVNKDVPHKIVFLDEAENMTQKAQDKLGILMEKYNKIKFAFTCNSIKNIIESIQSKCITYTYNKISKKCLVKIIMDICRKEGIADTTGVRYICSISMGDVRKAIGYLQSCITLKKDVSLINAKSVCIRHYSFITKDIINACITKDIKTALTHIDSLYNYGYNSVDIVTFLNLTIQKMDSELDLNDHKSWPSRLLYAKYITIVSLSSIPIYKRTNNHISNLYVTSLIAQMCDNNKHFFYDRNL